MNCKNRRKNVSLKKFIIGGVLLLVTFGTFGQLKNFGTKAHIKPQPQYKYSVYGYYDIVREFGFGFQQQLSNVLSLDYSLYRVYSYGTLYQHIHQWDYYDYQGYGFGIKPKFMFSALNRLYIGMNLTFEKLHHGDVPVEYYNGSGSQFYHERMKSEGYGYTIGMTMGNRFAYEHIMIEPFISMGVTTTVMHNTIYSSTYEYYQNSPQPVYPYDAKQTMAFFHTNIGLKLGFSFKKSKKHNAIDKKFDAIYIPKTVSLYNYLKTLNFKDPKTSKYLKQARSRAKGLNYSILRRYKRYYTDTSLFYIKTDALYKLIDDLIIKGNQ